MSPSALRNHESAEAFIEEAREQRNLDLDVRTALQQSSYSSVRNVEYQLDGGELTLLGTVPSFYMKQMANTTVAKIHGVEVVYNLLDVA